MSLAVDVGHRHFRGSISAMRRFLTPMFLLALAACGGAAGSNLGPGPTTTDVPAPRVEVVEPSGELLGLEAVQIAAGFDRPVDARAPIGDDRIWVAEQKGVVWLVDENGRVGDEPLLDIAREVSFDENEQGLLSIAFHPRFFENRRLYIYYTDNEGDSQLEELRMSEADPDRLDLRTRRTVLSVEQPQQWHQSGSIDFGPDGYLWLSLGDGGGIGDRFENGQDPTTILSSIVRIDVDAREPYAIPPDNPFVGSEGGEIPEIWAYGLRNPWRITIDEETGLLFIPDVGQESSEEINVVRLDSGGGQNFGWPIVEGTTCYVKDTGDDDGSEDVSEEVVTDCDTEGITMPLHELRRPGLCALVGGPVYRGSAIPELHGTYFYADYCVGWLRSFRTDGVTLWDEREWRDEIGTLENPSSLGTDGNGEILITTLPGDVFRLAPLRAG